MPGRAALDRAGVPADRVDLVVLATTTEDRVCPATAATVQDELGTRGAAFDLNAACSGFVYALHIGAALLRTPGIEHVLVIGSDRFAAYADPQDRTTAVLFGDGAGAVLLGRVGRSDRSRTSRGRPRRRRQRGRDPRDQGS